MEKKTRLEFTGFSILLLFNEDNGMNANLARLFLSFPPSFKVKQIANDCAAEHSKIVTKSIKYLKTIETSAKFFFSVFFRFPTLIVTRPKEILVNGVVICKKQRQRAEYFGPND